MWKAILCGAGASLAAAVSFAQVPSSPAIELANLREDVRLLSQRLGELGLRVEELERENDALRNSLAGLNQSSYATVAQLNAATAELDRAIKAGDAATAERAATQIKELGRQTNAAIDSLAKGLATRPAVQTTFTEDYPKEGISYTVQKGDTLAVISRKTGASVRDIVNANKISDPSKIQVGQTLFIPGGK